MDILQYILIFIIGTVFGSFFSLAIYRIPKKKDITHTNSHCPYCNHKLGFLDLIPIFSYIFLLGKCRYCKQKIRPRYFIMEMISGLTFVIIAYLMNVNIESLTPILLVETVFMVLYLCFIFIMAGIDVDNRKIEKAISMYGILLSIAYIIYLCVVEHESIYRYILYLLFFAIVLTLDTVTLKRYARNSYFHGILLTVLTMGVFTGEFVMLSTVIMTAFVVAIYLLLHKIKYIGKRIKKEKLDYNKNIPYGYILGICNILNLIFVLAGYKFFI